MSDRCVFHCPSCLLAHIAEGRKADDELYLNLLEAYEAGTVDGSYTFDQLLVKENLVRSLSEIRSLVERHQLRLEQLPHPIQDLLKSQQDYVVDYRVLEPAEPERGPLVSELPLEPALQAALSATGIEHLYQFQADAIRRALDGENVVVVAPTGTGKTEAFAVPLLQLIATRSPRFGSLRMGAATVTGLIIYPTKALARDQYPKLRRLADPMGIRLGIFDGDTPRNQRERVLADPPHIIITNFDTLHRHMMYRTAFARSLKKVRYVVVDEVHVYTGTFGANVHHILRRLRRLTGHFQICAASATIANPGEFCSQLFSTTVTVIQAKTAKRGRIHFLTLFPSLHSHRALVLDALNRLTQAGYRTLSFSSSHLGAELTAFYGRRMGLTIEVHRAGLPIPHRRRVEDEFKAGRLNALAATPTLELGLDIGLVDAVVSDLVNINRLLQRTGRAGRRRQESVAILALHNNDPISQYYRLHPDEYFADIEPGYVDPANPVIAERQLLAAALDAPLRSGEYPEFAEVIEQLLHTRLLTQRDGGLAPDYPIARHLLNAYDIRGSGETVVIRREGRAMGERSMPQAMEELHPGAVYFHAGRRYRSRSFTFHRGTGYADLEPLPPNYPYYTRALREESPEILRIRDRKRVDGVDVAYADLAIEKQVVGYVSLELRDEAGAGERTYLPEPLTYRFQTKGLALQAPRPDRTLAGLDEHRRDDAEGSSYHATEHALIEGTNTVTGGAADDMGGISLGSSGLIFVYDGAVGGNGASRVLFERLDRAFARAAEIMRSCPCTREDGCPRCTYSYRCGNNNDFLYKRGAVEVYERILAGERTNLTLGIGQAAKPFV